jgi:hypothetical protein
MSIDCSNLDKASNSEANMNDPNASMAVGASNGRSSHDCSSLLNGTKKGAKTSFDSDTIDHIGDMLLYFSGYFVLLAIYQYLEMVYRTIGRDLT